MAVIASSILELGLCASEALCFSKSLVLDLPMMSPTGLQDIVAVEAMDEGHGPSDRGVSWTCVLSLIRSNVLNS